MATFFDRQPLVFRDAFQAILLDVDVNVNQTNPGRPAARSDSEGATSIPETA
jgi:hypothetical protein